MRPERATCSTAYGFYQSGMPTHDLSARRAFHLRRDVRVRIMRFFLSEKLLHTAYLCIMSLWCESSRYTEWSMAARRHYVRAVCGVNLAEVPVRVPLALPFENLYRHFTAPFPYLFCTTVELLSVYPTRTSRVPLLYRESTATFTVPLSVASATYFWLVLHLMWSL